jgi:hypothetical protein
MASDMTGPTVSQRVGSPPAGVSPRAMFTSDLASRSRHQDAGTTRTGQITGREVPESAMKLPWPGFRGRCAR